jgi:hypothetical protein
MILLPMLQKFLPFLVVTTFVDLRPPQAHEWRIINDQTERGGASTGEVVNVAGGIEFSGNLGSIPGRDGKPVAFSLARVEFQPPKDAAGVKVTLSSFAPITALLVVSVKASSPMPARGEPVLTYQKAIKLDGGFDPKTISIPWSDFEATVRGKKAKDAPALDVSRVDAWAIEVTRSSQPGSKRYEPIEFRIRVL